MKYLLIAVFVFALAACESTFEPPVVDEIPPVVEVPAPLDPLPIPEPGVEWAPVGTCPIRVAFTELLPSPDRPAVLRVSLGSPCEDGQLVPFIYREDLLWDTVRVDIVDGVLIAGRSLHGTNAVYLAVPWNERDRRFEVVDARTGEVVASLQNYRLRVSRPF